MIEIEENLIEECFRLIDKLGNPSKLELISRLSLSMINKNEKVDNSVLKLYGSFDTKESAEELIEGIRSARLFN